ncbi:hypothetical protein [uncultured Lacinutrix sp.]|uniref:hypothetical protein n=1 Tax=uncultured Lacinutrix sp. TaxID=574032 RepID=UPI002617B0E1|nr:hypothetical protein [uncultured Lacinutrix sp.]
MSKTDLNILYNELIIKLRNDFVFFIPKAVLDIDIPNKLKLRLEQSIDLLFDNVLIIKLRKGTFLFDSKEDTLRFLKKHEELSEIIFTLLEKKNELQDFQFSYILDKYFKQIESLFYIVNWLSLNIEKLDPKDLKFKGLFISQHEYYKQHLEDFIRNFYPDKTHIPDSKFDILKHIELNFKDLTNIPFNSEILPEKTKDVFTTLINEKQKEVKQVKVKVKKKVLVTEQEAEDFILRTVFNIDI